MEKQIENIEDRLDDHDTKFNKIFDTQDEQGKNLVKQEERMSNMKGEIKGVKNTFAQDVAETRSSMKSIQGILTAMQIDFAVNDRVTKDNDKETKEQQKTAYNKSQAIATGLLVGIPSIVVSITIIIVTILLK